MDKIWQSFGLTTRFGCQTIWQAPDLLILQANIFEGQLFEYWRVLIATWKIQCGHSDRPERTYLNFSVCHTFHCLFWFSGVQLPNIHTSWEPAGHGRHATVTPERRMNHWDPLVRICWRGQHKIRWELCLFAKAEYVSFVSSVSGRVQTTSRTWLHLLIAGMGSEKLSLWSKGMWASKLRSWLRCVWDSLTSNSLTRIRPSTTSTVFPRRSSAADATGASKVRCLLILARGPRHSSSKPLYQDRCTSHAMTFLKYHHSPSALRTWRWLLKQTLVGLVA